MTTEQQKLVIAISSRALFDLREGHSIYETKGLREYSQYQIAHEEKPLQPGEAFSLVEKLLRINQQFDEARVEVILISRNSADTGLRVFNSIAHYNLPITRAAFTGGRTPYEYASAFGAHLFLSTHAEDVRSALNAGMAAAAILGGPAKPSDDMQDQSHEQLRIAFDGDAVLFSDEAEKVYQAQGLKAFTESEKASAKLAIGGGPFKPFLARLHALQSELSAEECPIRTALVTARSAPAHERVVRTLRDWKIRIDESLFLGGMNKGQFLRAFGADIFFDDQEGHCASAQEHVTAGHVPHGVVNEVEEV